MSIEELLGPWARERDGSEGGSRRAPFDVLLSDMGPDTTGDPSGDSVRSIRLCHSLLDRAAEWLRRGGHLAMKVYEGGDYPELLRRTRALFQEVKGYKPEASRRESVEIFLVGKGWKGRVQEASAPDPAAPERKTRGKTRGWDRPE